MTRRSTDQQHSADTDSLQRNLSRALQTLDLAARNSNDILYEWNIGGESCWKGALGPILGLSDRVAATEELWQSLLYPDDKSRVLASLDEALAGRADRWSCTYRMRRANGTVATVLDRAQILRDAEGRAYRMVGWLIDLSAQIDLGEQLAESERKYNALFAQSLDAMVFTSPDGAFLDANPAALRMFGLRRDLLTKFRAEDAYVDPADRLVLARRMVQQGSVDGYEMRLRRAGGATFLASYSGTVCRRETDGSIVGYIGSIRDITAAREAEERLRESEERLKGSLSALQRSEAKFRAIIENAKEVVVLIGADGVIRYATPSVEMFEGVKVADVVGRPLTDFIPDDDRVRVGLAFKRVLQDGGAEDIAPYRVMLAGQTIWAEARLTNMLGHPAIDAVVMHARDVTSRVVAEEARNRVEEQFRQAQKMEAIGRLAGGVAHDFNNLLTAITGSAELAHETATDPELRADLEAIRTAAYKAAAITRQLLAFSRKQMTSPRVVDVDEAISGFETLLRRLVAPKITFDLALESRAAVHVDPVQLEQALLNLVVNANDAMPNGGTVSIRTSTSGDGRSVAVEVQDTGVGIEASVRARIFEPFFTTKPPGHGTGLGLSTVYGIVEQAGGRIEVDSLPGRGSTFRLLFPAAQGAVTNTAEHRVPALDVRGTETVMVVDDEASVRMPLCKSLTRLGYRVIEAKHGRDALTLMDRAEYPVDLVITDLVMPEMGGAELVAQLRATSPSLPVIFVSGYSRETDAARGAASDAPFLQKPFSMSAVVRTVRETLDRAAKAAPSTEPAATAAA